MVVKKLVTSLCAIALAMAMSNTSLLAEKQLNECFVIDGENVKVSVKCSDYTYNDDETITLYPPWHLDDGDGGYRANTKHPKNFKRCPMAIKIDIIIKSGFGNELLLESNQLVSSQIIDHLTGDIIGTTIINRMGSISTENLEAGKTYSILSTNNAGATDNKMFMLNNDKQIWIGK